MLRGETGRDKLVAVAGLSAAPARDRLARVIAADFAVRRIGRLATLAGPAPRTGAAMRDLGLRADAAVAAAVGRIVWVGDDREFEAGVALAPGATVLDAAGAAVVPGFVDAHTHLAFAGDRDDEIRRRLAGASYEEIAAAGGGIVRTVEATRAASRRGAGGPRRRRGSTRCCCAARPPPR